MPWNGLKIEIYDFHQYSCSPEKVFPYELEPLGSLLSPIHGHTYSKWILTIQGVLKMENALKLAKGSLQKKKLRNFGHVAKFLDPPLGRYGCKKFGRSDWVHPTLVWTFWNWKFESAKLISDRILINQKIEIFWRARDGRWCWSQ